MNFSERLWNSVYGNEKLKNMLASDIANGKMSHAYIIDGAPGSGKLTLVRTLAAVMSKNENDAAKIISGISPDVIEISVPEKRKTIGIDTIREIKSIAYIKPNDLEFKFIVVREAQAMTVQAENAFLKLIEEPPKNVYIFLLCSNSSVLLPTIRSRAPVLRMQKFTQDEMDFWLTENNRQAALLRKSDKNAFDEIIMSSNGSIGEAVNKFESRKKTGLDSSVIIELAEAICRKERVKLLLAVNALPADREEFGKSITMLRLALRDVLAKRYGEFDDMLYLEKDKIMALSRKMPVEMLLKAADILSRVENELFYNPNIQNAKSNLYVSLIGL